MKTAVITPTVAEYKIFCSNNSNDGRDYVHISNKYQAEMYKDDISGVIEFGGTGSMSDYKEICRILKMEVV